jgi:hypothetical protein
MIFGRTPYRRGTLPRSVWSAKFLNDSITRRSRRLLRQVIFMVQPAQNRRRDPVGGELPIVPQPRLTDASLR